MIDRYAYEAWQGRAIQQCDIRASSVACCVDHQVDPQKQGLRTAIKSADDLLTTIHSFKPEGDPQSLEPPAFSFRRSLRQIFGLSRDQTSKFHDIYNPITVQ
jgi:hypothetical protein